jgi:cyclophilin family peptidyl-prolyl cis-trans isomerase/HEAT repeat protein
VRPVLSVALLVAAGGCGPGHCGQSDARAVARIAAWEQRRTLGAGTLAAWARDPMRTPVVRARALLAMARLQDPETAPTVAAALADPDAAPRAMAAFAAGVLGLAWEGIPDAVRVQLADAVLAAEVREADAEARSQELTALGRLRTPPALDRLVQRLAAEPEIAERAATALGVAARAKAPWPEAATPLLAGRLAGTEPESLRWAAAYALGYAAAADARAPLLGALTDPAGGVRAIAAKGLDRGPPEDAQALRPLLTDPSPGAAAEAARTLAKLAVRCRPGDACPPLEVLAGLAAAVDGVAHGDGRHGAPPLEAVSQAGLPPVGQPVLAALRAKIRTAIADAEASAAARTDLAWLDCRLAAAQDRNTGWLDETPGCGAGLVSEPRRLKLGMDEVAQSPRLKTRFDRAAAQRYLASPDPTVRVAAVNLLAASQHPEAAEDLRGLVSSADAVLSAAAAAAVGALGDAASGAAVLARAEVASAEPEAADAWADALVALKPEGTLALLHRWLNSSHAHQRDVAARALTKLEGKEVRPPGHGPEGQRTSPVADPVPAGTVWRFPTARGVVVIQTDVDAAPETVAQLSRLARAGFFTGLTFHRVVPDFVVQGGDPRGDGEGGPGFTLPCEVSPRRYRRGTVGMALSGKDTGGSQIFVALSPQPHLEGRYTIVGEVVAGMDALDGVLEGDGMGTVEVLEGATGLSHR